MYEMYIGALIVNKYRQLCKSIKIQVNLRFTTFAAAAVLPRLVAVELRDVHASRTSCKPEVSARGGGRKKNQPFSGLSQTSPKARLNDYNISFSGFGTV